MSALSPEEQEKVNASFEYGAKSFTENDLDQVIREKNTAMEKGARIEGFFEEFQLLWSLLCDYKNGSYRKIPWRFVASVGFAIAYLVAPIDVIPDFIPFVGLVDDAAVFGLLIAGFKKDIETYRTWKLRQKAEPPSPEK